MICWIVFTVQKDSNPQKRDFPTIFPTSRKRDNPRGETLQRNIPNTGDECRGMGITRGKASLLALLGLLAASRSASALPWTVGFGGCSFSGDSDGAPLVRSGSCPTQGGSLNLSNKGITSVLADAFAGMTKMQ
jgi:hypothetical protein